MNKCNNVSRTFVWLVLHVMEKIPVRQLDPFSDENISLPGFTIRSIGEVLAGKDMVQELHRHDFYYILILEKGSGSHEIDFVAYKTVDFSIFIMRPGQVHRLTLNEGSSGYLMQFKMDLFHADDLPAQKLRKLSAVNGYYFDPDEFSKYVVLSDNILEEFQTKREAYIDVIRMNLGLLFIEMLRAQADHDNGISDRYMQQRLEEFQHLLETNIVTLKRVADYAQLLNLSNYQLNAMTKKVFGKTPSEIIDDYVILESKRYLLAGNYQIKEIAYHLGYEDASYFIRFFKKKTGQSPDVFRQNYR